MAVTHLCLSFDETDVLEEGRQSQPNHGSMVVTECHISLSLATLTSDLDHLDAEHGGLNVIYNMQLYVIKL